MQALQAKGARTDLALTGQKTYDQITKQFVDWLGNRQLSEAELKQYFSELSENKRPATVALYRAALKAAIKKAAGQNASAQSLSAIDAFFRSIKVPKIDRTVYPDEVLTADEVRSLVANAPKRISALIGFLYVSGLRISEALSVRLADCKKTGELVKIRVLGKGRKERTVFVSEKVYKKAVDAFSSKTFLFENRKGKRYSRQYFDREIRNAGSRILGKAFGAHTLRHSHATSLLKSGESLKAVSKNLGHSDPGFTAKVYIHDTVSETAICKLSLSC